MVKLTRNQKQRHLITKKRVLIIVGALLIAVSVLAYLYLFRDQQTPAAGSSPQATKTKINLEPATDQEKKDAEDRKDQIATEDVSDGSNPTTSSVKPVIVYADSGSQTIEVGAFVAGLNGDGTCTLTATHGASKVTRQTEAFNDATTTACKPFSIERSAFRTTGTWVINVSYASATASGTSDNKNLEIR